MKLPARQTPLLLLLPSIIYLALVPSSSVYAQETTPVAIEVTTVDGNIIRGTIVSIDQETGLVILSGFGRLELSLDSVASIEGTWATLESIDGERIQGVLYHYTGDETVIRTDVGLLTTPANNSRIVSWFRTDVTDKVRQWAAESSSVAIASSQSGTTLGTDLTSVLLYEQQRKQISTAVMFQTLGAGLIYAERQGLGITMLLLEWGLMLSPLVLEQEWAPYLTYGGAAVRAVNLFTTIRAVNEFNDNLALSLGVPAGTRPSRVTESDGPPRAIVYEPTYPGYTINGEPTDILAYLNRIVNGEENIPIDPQVASSYIDRLERQRLLRNVSLIGGIGLGTGILLADYLPDNELSRTGRVAGQSFGSAGFLVFAGSMLFGTSAGDVVDELNRLIESR